MIEVDSLSTIRQSVVDTALFYTFVREETGNNDGYWVEEFIGSTGLNPKGNYAWCAAYITYTFKVNGLEVPKYSARARAWFEDGKLIAKEDIQPGDLGSLWYKSLNRIGHIVMFTQTWNNGANFIRTVEGNTNDVGSRDGKQNGGVYLKIRPKALIYSASNHIPKELEIKIKIEIIEITKCPFCGELFFLK